MTEPISPRERRGLIILTACMLIAVAAVALAKCSQNASMRPETAVADSLQVTAIHLISDTLTADTINNIKPKKKPSRKKALSPAPSYRAPLDEPAY